MSDLPTLTTLAGQAAAIQADLDAAAAAERTAAAAALRAVIAAAQPALRSIAGRIRTSCRTEWHGQYTEDVTDHYSVRGVYLGAGRAGPTAQQGPDDTRGRYAGSDLYLLADGTLLTLHYDGDWSRWQGATSEWTADIAVLSIEDALAAHGAAAPESVADRLAEALRSVIAGAAPERAKALRARADRLAAIAALA